MKDIKTSKEDHQSKQPGIQSIMEPLPETIRESYTGSGKLKNKVALITGGDSGIGKSVAVHFAREGAKVVIVYLNEDVDAETTKAQVEQEGTACLLIKGDIRDEAFCEQTIAKTVANFGQLDCLVNNAAIQFPTDSIEEIQTKNLKATFDTNIFPYFYLVQAAMPHLKSGATIVNTTSVTAYRGSSHLIDYASTKGAIVSFTRSLSKSLAEKGIRVNGVAPGPIWTPLIPATFSGEDLENFGTDVPLKRPGQPSEVGPAYVFLASEDSSYMTGQIMHINGGEIIGG